MRKPYDPALTEAEARLWQALAASPHIGQFYADALADTRKITLVLRTAVMGTAARALLVELRDAAVRECAYLRAVYTGRVERTAPITVREVKMAAGSDGEDAEYGFPQN